MFFRPAAKNSQRIDQRTAEAGERVFHFRRNDGMDFAQNESVTFQAAQRLREHLLRDAADRTLKRSITLRPIRQDLDDESGPFVGDAFEHDPGRTLWF